MSPVRKKPSIVVASARRPVPEIAEEARGRVDLDSPGDAGRGASSPLSVSRIRTRLRRHGPAARIRSDPRRRHRPGRWKTAPALRSTSPEAARQLLRLSAAAANSPPARLERREPKTCACGNGFGSSVAASKRRNISSGTEGMGDPLLLQDTQRRFHVEGVENMDRRAGREEGERARHAERAAERQHGESRMIAPDRPRARRSSSAWPDSVIANARRVLVPGRARKW